jgi:hypothetical protein
MALCRLAGHPNSAIIMFPGGDAWPLQAEDQLSYQPPAADVDALQLLRHARGLAIRETSGRIACRSALAESFVATLKIQCFANSIAPTKAAAKPMIFDYIETFYNTVAVTARWAIARPRNSKRLALLARRGLFWRRQPRRRDLPQKQVGSSRLGCEQLPRVFKPPETTRSHHLKTFNSTP